MAKGGGSLRNNAKGSERVRKRADLSGRVREMAEEAFGIFWHSMASGGVFFKNQRKVRVLPFRASTPLLRLFEPIFSCSLSSTTIGAKLR